MAQNLSHCHCNVFQSVVLRNPTIRFCQSGRAFLHSQSHTKCKPASEQSGQICTLRALEQQRHILNTDQASEPLAPGGGVELSSEGQSVLLSVEVNMRSQKQLIKNSRYVSVKLGSRNRLKQYGGINDNCIFELSIFLPTL